MIKFLIATASGKWVSSPTNTLTENANLSAVFDAEDESEQASIMDAVMQMHGTVIAIPWESQAETAARKYREAVALQGMPLPPIEQAAKLSKALGLLAPKGTWLCTLLENIWRAANEDDALKIATEAQAKVSERLWDNDAPAPEIMISAGCTSPIPFREWLRRWQLGELEQVTPGFSPKSVLRDFRALIAIIEQRPFTGTGHKTISWFEQEIKRCNDLMSRDGRTIGMLNADVDRLKNQLLDANKIIDASHDAQEIKRLAEKLEKLEAQNARLNWELHPEIR